VVARPPSRPADRHGLAAEPIPRLLAGVYSTHMFLSRLLFFTGEPLEPGGERWAPLVDWWRGGAGLGAPGQARLREKILAHAPEMADVLVALRAWEPSPSPAPGTPFGDVYARLAERYRAVRELAYIRSLPPGPLDARHPGFTFAWDPKVSAFTAAEWIPRAIGIPRELRFTLPLLHRSEPRFADGELDESDAPDAWSLFALRAILIALHAREDAAVLALERDVARPAWDHILEQLAPRPARREARTEQAYHLSPGTRPDWLWVVAYSRRATTDGKTLKWKKRSFDSLYGDLSELDPLDRDIVRLCLALDRHGMRGVELGAPLGHEIAKLLAQHPRVSVSESDFMSRPTMPEDGLPADLVVGELSMRLEHLPSGGLSPSFFVGEREIAAAMLEGGASDAIRAAKRGPLLVSVSVPAPLRPWLAASAQMGMALTFPPDAVPKVVEATEPLVASGVATVPRTALGVEAKYRPEPALRVDWRKEGAAVVEVVISAHPHAPLLPAGAGPELFTFVHAGSRYFVDRDFAREREVASAVRDQISPPLMWDERFGRTENIDEAIALAAFLDQNPLGLRVEVAVGSPPSVTPLTAATRSLQVRRKGTWLVLDGGLELQGAKLTTGEVLDAVRHARRYVKAADGVFLELTKAALAELETLAMACDLYGGLDEDGHPRLHEAFAHVLAEASSVFDRVSGVDLQVYAERFAARDQKVATPSLEKGKLRPYQREGVLWMLRLATWAPGCVLADDMGLGKTVQTAALLRARAHLGPQLIVAPASVSSNWMSELARFVPGLRARWYNDDRDVAPSDLGPNDVLVVSYGLLQRAGELFAAQRWTTLVVDEAQYVKNITAQRTDAVRGLSRDFTVALTGTPLENHLGELFSVMDLAFPGLLGEEPTFRERFRKPIEGSGDAARLLALGRLISPFLLRRTRGAVLEELPAREEITETLDLTEAEKRKYLAFRKACEDEFAKGKRKKGETAAQLKVALFAALTRLRQLACDVRLVDPTFDGGSTKIARTVELAVELAGEGNRALVFSTFTSFLDKIRADLEVAGLRVGYLTGETPTKKRKEIVDAFQAGEYDVFCVSLLAGGTGLNLTKASYVIHTDPWWNPAAEEQATSRAHRMGQTEPVTVYRLVSRGTIEEAVLSLHEKKKELAAAVLDGKASAKAITTDELLELLRFAG